MYALDSYVRNDMLLPSSASIGTPGSRTAARHKPLRESIAPRTVPIGDLVESVETDRSLLHSFCVCSGGPLPKTAAWKNRDGSSMVQQHT